MKEGLTLVKLQYTVPNPDNPCSHSFSCAATVEGVLTDSVPEAVEMVCDALRRQLIGDKAADMGTPDQNPQCDGKGGCGGTCHRQGEPTAEGQHYDEAADPAGGDGDDTTAFGDEPSDREHGEFRARQPLLQRQCISIDLPSGGHVFMPDNFVFFGPARLFEEMF